MGRKDKRPKPARPKPGVVVPQANYRDTSPRTQKQITGPKPSFLNRPGPLAGVLFLFCVTAFLIGWITDFVYLLVSASLLISLAVVGLAPAFREFRNSYSLFFNLLAALTVAGVVGIFATLFLSDVASKSTEKAKVKRLLEAAMHDADNTRIDAQTLVLMMSRTQREEPAARLSETAHRNPFPIPEKFLEITSNEMVLRNISPETLSEFTSLKRNITNLVEAINHQNQSDDNLKQSTVLYIDLLMQLDVLLPLEVMHIDGKIDSVRLNRYHQDMIEKGITLFAPGFVNKAFENTNLIVDRYLSPKKRP